MDACVLPSGSGSGSGSGAAGAGAGEGEGAGALSQAAADAKQQIGKGKVSHLVHQWEQSNPSPSAEQQSMISWILHFMNKGLESAGKYGAD